MCCDSTPEKCRGCSSLKLEQCPSDFLILTPSGTKQLQQTCTTLSSSCSYYNIYIYISMYMLLALSLLRLPQCAAKNVLLYFTPNVVPSSQPVNPSTSPDPSYPSDSLCPGLGIGMLIKPLCDAIPTWVPTCGSIQVDIPWGVGQSKHLGVSPWCATVKNNLEQHSIILIGS